MKYHKNNNKKKQYNYTTTGNTNQSSKLLTYRYTVLLKICYTTHLICYHLQFFILIHNFLYFSSYVRTTAVTPAILNLLENMKNI